VVRLWDVQTGKLDYERKGHAIRVHTVAFAPDGRSFASVGGNVRVWKTDTGEELRNFSEPPNYRDGDSQGLAFSPDGALLASSFRENIYIWHLQGEGAPLIIVNAQSPIVTSVVFADNRILVSGGHSSVCWWDISSGKRIRKLQAVDEHGGSLALAADRMVLGAIYGSKIFIWDNSTGKRSQVIEHRNFSGYGARRLAMSPDGDLVAAGGDDCTVHIWKTVSGTPVSCFLDSHTDRILSACFSPTGRYALMGSDDGSARLWDATTSQLIRAIPLDTKLHCGGVRAVYSPDGKKIAVGGWTDSPNARFVGLCRILDSKTGKDVIVQSLPHRITGLAFSPDGRCLVLARWDLDQRQSRIHLWDFSANASPVPLTAQMVSATEISRLLYLPDSNILASVENRRLKFYDIDARNSRSPLIRPQAALHEAAFSANGKIGFTSGFWSDLLSLWDLTRGEELSRITVKKTGINVVALSPDGRLAASSSPGFTRTDQDFDDASVHVWETLTGGKVLPFHLPGANVTELAFSAEGRFLISGLNNGTALIWGVMQKSTKNSSTSAQDEAWQALASPDPSKALAAVCSLVATPETTIPLLMERLRPAPEINKDRVQSFIASLESNRFAVRQAATKELASIAEKAPDMLRLALAKKPSLEVKTRLEKLLVGGRMVRSPARLRALRANQVLEGIGSNEARQFLKELARGFPAARETQDAAESLQRLEKRTLDRE
jgi:WD40 repeat protein